MKLHPPRSSVFFCTFALLMATTGLSGCASSGSKGLTPPGTSYAKPRGQRLLLFETASEGQTNKLSTARRHLSLSDDGSWQNIDVRVAGRIARTRTRRSRGHLAADANDRLWKRLRALVPQLRDRGWLSSGVEPRTPAATIVLVGFGRQQILFQRRGEVASPAFRAIHELLQSTPMTVPKPAGYSRVIRISSHTMAGEGASSTLRCDDRGHYRASHRGDIGNGYEVEGIAIQRVEPTKSREAFDKVAALLKGRKTKVERLMTRGRRIEQGTLTFEGFESKSVTLDHRDPIAQKVRVILAPFAPPFSRKLPFPPRLVSYSGSRLRGGKPLSVSGVVHISGLWTENVEGKKEVHRLDRRQTTRLFTAIHQLVQRVSPKTWLGKRHERVGTLRLDGILPLSAALGSKTLLFHRIAELLDKELKLTP